MWIVATLLEFQETELNLKLQKVTCKCRILFFNCIVQAVSHLFLQPGLLAVEQHQERISKSPSCCAQDSAATASSETPPVSHGMEILMDVQCFTSSLLVKKRHFILRETGKICDSYYTELMLNNFNFENFKSIQYFIDMFLHNTLKMTNSI